MNYLSTFPSRVGQIVGGRFYLSEHPPQEGLKVQVDAPQQLEHVSLPDCVCSAPGEDNAHQLEPSADSQSWNSSPNRAQSSRAARRGCMPKSSGSGLGEGVLGSVHNSQGLLPEQCPQFKV